MDKYEYKLCIEEILDLIDKKKYSEAAEIADTVDWKNEKNVRMLCKISDLYKICKRYGDSREVLLLAYHRNPSGRMIIYSLCELSIKLKDLENAYEFYREYTLVAPRDYGRLVLKYKIYTARGVDLEHRISTLEELKQIDYKEKWMYELAYLYHQAGQDDKCIEQCDEIIIFYGEGKYVIKALELKAAHTVLTPNQEALYQRLTAPAEPEISVQVLDEGAYSDRAAQQEIASGMQEILAKDKPAEQAAPISNPAVDEQATTIFSPAEVVKALEEDASGETRVIDINLVRQEMEKAAAQKQEEEALAKADTAEIRIPRQIADVQPIIVPLDSAAGVAEAPADTVSEPAAEKAPEPVPEQKAEPVIEHRSEIPPRDLSSESGPTVGNPAVRRVVEPESRSGGMYEMVIGEHNNPVIKYPSYDDMVSVQGDGQITFVLPEEEKPDKQITGQISISDIMLEWERVKQEGEKQWSSEVAKRVQEQTEGMFKSFEESAKNGLLEQLESGIYHEVGEPVVLVPETEAPPPAPLPTDEGDSESDTDSDASAAVPVPEVVPVPPSVEMHEILVDGTDNSSALAQEQDPEVQNSAASDLTATDSAPQDLPSDEAARPADDEPTAVELTFDRTPFLGKVIETEPEITSNNPEPPAADNTGVIPAGDIDYLLRFAAAGEERDRQDSSLTGGEDVLPVQAEAEKEPAQAQEETAPANDTLSADDTASDTVAASDDGVAAGDSQPEKQTAEPEPKEEAVAHKETGLTPEQEERFESFIQTEGGLSQIRSALETVSVEPASGNLIITGEDRDSAIELGKAIIMELSEKGQITGKVAKIKAETLNKSKDPAATLAALKDGALIVLDAGEINPDTLEQIQKAVAENEIRIFITLIVRKRNKNRFMENCGNSLSSFDTSIDIEALEDAMLVKLATEYAFSREFAIDEMGLLELHRRISDMQTDSHKVLLTEVKEIVDEAITHAVRMTPANFFRVLAGKRYNENDMIVLTQRDFEE